MEFTEDDKDTAENLKINTRTQRGIITVNTQNICAYYADKNDSTAIILANGEPMSVPVSLKKFETILSRVETIIDLAKFINEN